MNQVFNRYLKLHKGIVQSSLSFYTNRHEFEDDFERPLSERLNVEHLSFGKRAESVNYQKQLNNIIDTKSQIEFRRLQSNTIHATERTKGKLFRKGTSVGNLKNAT